ncbi:histidine phosphatase family protein [Clostridium estertheticum]|uniref:Histidine phosphatase family protein n=1 Tax=Clostridium estertheticum TaxID=238834 RepID=A0AA47EKE7_9CLOT|nr:histidine phosphatase family protein [Clostridium estertheticum]MBU3157222.1 histidine phosphatase family protein [Clostridium estertheticum]MBU3200876.1 histidine phosphatase family protein [Clostridium estertheticum]WAG61859.1 histidine phosphatase family protein [Clostridium estertheticum]WAG64022.1 histidine phosphatase family protein [Clostridium estertheticum]
MSIFLLRHGETDWNTIDRCQGHTDIPLNETGKKKIEQVAFMFKRSIGDINYIVSSPLSRANESALIFSNSIGYKGEIIIDELFIERFFGLAEGLLGEEIKFKFPNLDVPEMEPEKTVFSRALQGLNYYDSIYSDVNILIVTHGAVLKTLVDNQPTCCGADINVVKSVPGGLFKLDLRNGEYQIKEIKTL